MTRQTRHRPGGVASEALLESIASITDECGAKQVAAKVREYLGPVLKADRSEQERLTVCSQQIAKSHSSFVVNLLRISMARVSSEHPPALLTAYVELASLGLEGLSVLRTFLKGRPHEVEVQRYMLLRKLVSLAWYHQALHQAWLLYNALCCQCWQTKAASLTTHSVSGQTTPLLSPNTSNTEIGSLVAGTVLNIILSIVEQGSIQPNLCKIMTIVHDYSCITEWLSMLPEADRVKHCDSLFRYLFKAAHQALSLKQQRFDEDTIKICRCTIQACLQSTSRPRLPQVVEKLVQQLPRSQKPDLVAQALEAANASGPVQGATLAMNIAQDCMAAVSCHQQSVTAFLEVLSRHQERNADDKLLALLQLPAATVLLASNRDCSNTHACISDAPAAIHYLLQRMHSECTRPRPATSATAAKDPAEADDGEAADLCQLARAVLAAITTLRKKMQGNPMCTSSDGEAYDEAGTHEEEPSSLCTCLTMAAPLASAVARLQTQQADDASQSSATDRLSYPALSALVTVCQVKTALTLQGSTQAAVCSADAFESFWSSATAWSKHPIPLLPLKAAEERWASSALFGCAVQLHSAQRQSAEILFTAACDAAASSLVKLMHDHSQSQLELQSQTQSFVRKSQALASALHQQSCTPAALSRLGNALALLASLGVHAVRSGQPLVQMLVTLRATLPSRHSAAATGKPGSRVRGQRKMMQSMQAHAAGAVPADADVAAYLKQLPQAAPADVVGEVLAMEAKAVHQAWLDGLLSHTHAVQQGQCLFMQLAKVWPAQKRPVMHAKVLLLQARLSGLLAEAERAQDLIEQVIELLTYEKKNDAPEVLACAHATRGLLHAQQLRQSSTGASPSKSAASPRQEWLPCFEHVRKALQLWQQSLQDDDETQDAVHTDDAGALWDASACLELMLELLVLTGLHGDQELQQLASGLLTDRAELSCPDSVLQALRNMPGSSLLAWTLCPHLTAAVLPADGPEPETQNSLADAYELCRPKPGSSAEDCTSSADSLQQMAHKLAASKQAKSPAVVWSRALMHHLAAQAHCQDGETTSALYNASEALRLGSTLFSLLAPERAAAPSDVGQPSAASSSSSESQDISADHAGQGQNPPQSQKTSEASLGGGTDHMQSAVGPDGMKNNAAGPGITQGPMSGEVGLEGVGYWQVTWLYLTSLLKLGEVYELAGSHEDALHAFKEGQELARRCSAERLCDVFSMRIAEVLLKRQSWLLYQQELDQLRGEANGRAESNDAIGRLLSASVARLQGLQAQHECCHQAADNHFQTAVGLLISSLEDGQDPGLHWLLQELLCDARLDQAESCLCLGDTVAAEGLTQAALSALQPNNPAPNASKGSKQRQRPTQSPPSASSPCHPIACARAFHMQAKIKAACKSPKATNQIALAGCASSLAERQQSNAHASTTAPTLSKPTARSSGRVVRPNRAGRGTVKGTNLKGHVVDDAHDEESSQGQQVAEGSDSEGMLQQAQLLLQAYQLSQGRPMLSREVARDLSQCCSKLGLVHAAVLLEHASFGASVSLQYRGILHSKLLALERRHLCGSATPEAEQASAAIKRAIDALTSGLLPEATNQTAASASSLKEHLQEVEGHASAGLHALASYLPPTVTVTSISISCPTPLHASPASDQNSKGHLIITRHQGTEPPILMTIPIPLGDFGNAPDSETEHPLCCGPSSQARAGALEEFDSIMADSTSSMKADVPLLTPADKTDWWRKRLELDQRMARLLQHLDCDWLGPWKVLFYGAPADQSTAAALCEAALEIASGLCKRSQGEPAACGTDQAQSSLQALLTVLMWGLASLTAAQLQAAAREVLCLADASVDDATVDQLCQQLRSRYDDACGTSITQEHRTACSPKQPSGPLTETTNVAHVVKKGMSRSSVKITAPATAVIKPRGRGRATSRGLQTTGKPASRTSRFAAMKSAATAAHPRRAPHPTDLSSPAPATIPEQPQDPALVSQLQARFDALALEEGQEEEQAQHESLQEGQGGGIEEGWTGRVLGHHPTLLVLDGKLQSIPWESLPSFGRLRMYRAPSLACAAAVAARQPLAAEEPLADSQIEATAVNMANTVYMVNPAGDLSCTQATFEETFRQQQTWQGTAGEPMAPGPLATALQGHDMFLYFGHGSGDQYLSARALRRMPRCASALLMGCSSGNLAAAGQYEPTGPVLAYLMAGCPVAVANLWDVTDRDIDRFSQGVLSKWMKTDAEEGSSEEMLKQPVCVSASVTASRKFCRLAALIGAAPVCYGVPVVISGAN